jgi:hypothetical protein
MRIRKLILPTFALGLAGVMLTPDIGRAFLKFNFSLNTGQRSVRVFNNFTAPGANNNTTPHAQFPGFTGAEMALWKAVVEWGSEPHGDGSGDPTQTNLGDGGANFDAHFIGNATGAGVIGNNVMSQISGCSGGVFAFMNGDAGGWRILFYQCWNWADGPGFIGGNEADLQGIGCHEYGHGLGLGHSSAGGATMFASTNTGIVGTRSIQADDAAGLQCKYGVKSAAKPHIDMISGVGNLTITGTDFPPNLEVWFPYASATVASQKQPLKVRGLTSNGTVVNVQFPAGAGPGDILVRNTATTGGSGLSNAFPYDPSSCPPPLFFCTAKPGLACGTPAISTFGSPSASASAGFVILAGPARSNKSGLLLYTDQGAGASAFNGGTLCIKAPLKRSAAVTSGGFGTCDGEFAIDMNAFAAGNSGGNPAAFLLTSGNVIFTQWWGRDSVATGSFLSDAMHYTVCP